MKIKPKKKHRGEVGCCAEMLSKGIIPQYFYMPITQAAKEPNLSLTPVKKRCREPDLRLTPSTEKLQGAGSWGAPAKICLLQGRRR